MQNLGFASLYEFLHKMCTPLTFVIIFSETSYGHIATSYLFNASTFKVEIGEFENLHSNMADLSPPLFPNNSSNPFFIILVFYFQVFFRAIEAATFI